MLRWPVFRLRFAALAVSFHLLVLPTIGGVRRPFALGRACPGSPLYPYMPIILEMTKMTVTITTA